MNAEEVKAELFDVFLCHNSEDKPAVREIAQQLAQHHLRPWLDEEQIQPGTLWQPALEQQIESIKSVAVFVGRSGLGPWQDLEIRTFINQFVRRNCPVIPVILPSAKTVPKLPLLLENFHYVDLRATDRNPLERLIWGVTGKKPGELSQVLDSEQSVTVPATVKGHLLPSREDRGAAVSKRRSGDAEISQARLYPPLAELPAREQVTQLEILRRRVMEYWVEGALKHSLHNEVLISWPKVLLAAKTYGGVFYDKWSRSIA